MTETLYPDWLDGHAVEDAAMGAAYEDMGAGGRAVLKTCIARLHLFWGEREAFRTTTRTFRQGFCARVEEEPASFALFVCPGEYPHPAPFLAALLPALLAGVDAILPVFVSPFAKDGASFGPVSPALLAALELAGIERAFVLDDKSTAALAEDLGGNRPGGRLVLLGAPSCREGLVLKALELTLPCLSLPHPPVYFNERLGKPVEHCFVPASFFGTEAPAAGKEQPFSGGQERLQAALCLDGAHEGSWVWPELGPDFFRVRRVRIFSGLGTGGEPA